MFKQRRAACAFLLLSLATGATAQTGAAGVHHQVEGRIMSRGARTGNIRVRLLRLPEMQPVSETFTRSEGHFRFTQVREGEYAVETMETERFEATFTSVQVRPIPRDKPSTFNVLVELREKPPEPKGKDGVGIARADLDAGAPRQAVERYLAGMRALREGDAERAEGEFKAAVKIHPAYYSARLEYGRALRKRGLPREAAEVLRPLREAAPRSAEVRIEYGLALLSLGRQEAAAELGEAVRLAPESWESHFYLGWALLDSDSGRAETHLRRAVELDERRAARAHLGLARIANERGRRGEAVAHLEAFLKLSPDSEEAEAARSLAVKLRATGGP
jgi:tetratricopeptide (TPR) repeat protein